MSIREVEFSPGGSKVTRVGLGGEGVLRTFGREQEARAVIEEALDSGLTYFDTAPAYSGSQAYLGSVWRARPERRAGIFQTSKSARRFAAGAMQDLEESLATLAGDHLDLWQIHDIRTQQDFDEIAGAGGALEAFVAAREQGKVKYIGVTGHHDPAILTRAVEEWPVDAVLMPVNPVEAVLGGFLDQTLPAAREKGVAVIAMKVLGGSHYLNDRAGLTAATLVRFALAQGVTLAIVGCRTPQEVAELALAGNAGPLPPDECRHLVSIFSPVARRLAFYRGGREPRQP